MYPPLFNELTPTFSANLHIIRILAAKGTNMLLCAPTGRAAKRRVDFQQPVVGNSVSAVEKELKAPSSVSASALQYLYSEC
jgi:hypothetical protein